MAKNDNKTWIILLLLVGVFAYGGTQGWFSGTTNLFPQQPYAPLNPPNQLMTYNCNLNIVPTTICVGDSATGTITSNIPNGVSSVWYNPNGAGWQLYKNVNLDASGGYSETNTMLTSGTVVFRAICCDRNGNCRVSNDNTLTVNVCPNTPKWLCCSGFGHYDCFQDNCPLGWTKINQFTSESTCSTNCNSGNTPASYTCGQGSDAQCGGTCPTTYSCAEIEGIQGTHWCACLNGGYVHPDWKPDGQYYNPIGGGSSCTESESQAIAISFTNNHFAFAKAQDSSCHPLCTTAMGFSNGWLFDCQYVCSVLGTYFLDVSVLNCVPSAV